VPRAAETYRRQIALGLDSDERGALKALDFKIKLRHTANAVPKQSGLSEVRRITAHIQECREHLLRRSRE
jgi:hypothetical protein